MSAPRRGEIYYVTFVPMGPVELSGPHPALVVQNDIGNRASRLTIVAGITTNLRVGQLPVGVLLDPGESGLPRVSAVHLGQLHTVDRLRLERRIGRLPRAKMREVDEALRVSLGLEPYAALNGRSGHGRAN